MIWYEMKWKYQDTGVGCGHAHSVVWRLSLDSILCLSLSSTISSIKSIFVHKWLINTPQLLAYIRQCRSVVMPLPTDHDIPGSNPVSGLTKNKLIMKQIRWMHLQHWKIRPKVPFRNREISKNAQEMGVEASQIRILHKILIRNSYIPASVYFCPG